MGFQTWPLEVLALILLLLGVQLSSPEWETQFQQALTAAGNPTLDQVLSEMAQTELPGIKVGEIEVGGRKRTSVLQIDRARLAG